MARLSRSRAQLTSQPLPLGHTNYVHVRREYVWLMIYYCRFISIWSLVIYYWTGEHPRAISTRSNSSPRARVLSKQPKRDESLRRLPKSVDLSRDFFFWKITPWYFKKNVFPRISQLENFKRNYLLIGTLNWTSDLRFFWNVKFKFKKLILKKWKNSFHFFEEWIKEILNLWILEIVINIDDLNFYKFKVQSGISFSCCCTLSLATTRGKYSWMSANKLELLRPSLFTHWKHGWLCKISMKNRGEKIWFIGSYW